MAEQTTLSSAEFLKLRSLILSEFPNSKFLYIARVAPRQKPNATRHYCTSPLNPTGSCRPLGWCSYCNRVENNRRVAKVQVHAAKSGVGVPVDSRQMALPGVMAVPGSSNGNSAVETEPAKAVARGSAPAVGERKR